MVANPLQLWGGVECTFNRVHDRFFDQCEMSGHLRRLSDLDLLADVGFRKMRYPVTWERHAPDSLDALDFRWVDERLNKMRELGITPIAGLLHHGSGPRYTNMVDEKFPEKLATYARAVAERYPWVEDFTPVNEPLTTARFSGLYGHWYPHGRDEQTFATCLLNELKGTVLAMKAIREVTPGARLIQTEDLAKIFCTPALKYQAEFENARRWITFDVLTGKLTPDMLMYQHFLNIGVPEEKLRWFLDNPCPPDIVGANYYATSERFLDDRMHAYSPEHWANNGRQTYADTAAVHVRGQGLLGLGRLLMESWDRYHLPLAVTEAHMGCTREEQVRWLAQIWEEAGMARRWGADVQAVTAWCLFGAFHWNTLVTRDDGCYEPGLFDLRAPEPRATALIDACSQLAAKGHAEHPALDSPGWWRRSSRFLFPVSYCAGDDLPSAIPELPSKSVRERKVVIVEAENSLGDALVRTCQMRGLAHAALRLRDVHDQAGLQELLGRHDAWAVIYCGHVRNAEKAELNPEACEHQNVDVPLRLAEWCANGSVRFLTFSSDEVFGGPSDRPLTEEDPLSPVNVLGRCTASVDSRLLQGKREVMVVRTGPLFGAWDQENFLVRALKQAATTNVVRVVGEEIHSATYIPDVVEAAMDLLIDGATGLWHLANAGATDLATLTGEVVDRAGFDRRLVQPLKAVEAARWARHGTYRALASARQTLMPPLASAIDRCLIELERAGIVAESAGVRVPQVA